MSSIQEELNRLTAARDNIKGVLDRLNVSYEGDKLDSLATAVNTIQKVEATQENGVITIPIGYISEELTFVVGTVFTTGYLISNADGSVYFQAVKDIDGEIVTDGEPVEVDGIDIPNLGQVVGAPDYSRAERAELYKCASVDTSTETWSGYKAVLNGNVYSFETSLTTGMSYAGLPTPIPGDIYLNGVRVKVQDEETVEVSEIELIDVGLETAVIPGTAQQNSELFIVQ